MGYRFIRPIISVLTSFGIAVPSPTLAASKILRTSKGHYAVLTSGTSKPKQNHQMIFGPDSSSIKVDLDGNGRWDHWEINKNSITIIAENPLKGHYQSLSYQYRLKAGYARADFIYEEKSGTYLLAGKGFEKYKKMNAENIIIGDCTTQDNLRKQANTWTEIMAKFGDYKEFTDWIFENNQFIDPSCKEGKFKDSFQEIKYGIGAVIQGSVRSEEDDPDLHLRFMSCMDHHGLGVHADRIRRTLLEKIDPQKAAGIYNRNFVGPVIPTKPAGGGAYSETSHSNLPQTIMSLNAPANFTRFPMENSADANNVLTQYNEDYPRFNEKPLVRCEFTPLDAETLKRANWDTLERQVTLNRLVSETLPEHKPYYVDEFNLKNASLPATKVDSYDYAKAFFHELIHASFIENEKFTQAIENCCGDENGFDLKNPACNAMDEYVKKFSAQQAFIGAMYKHNPEKYASYHQNLINKMGGLINLANFLEGDVVSRFRSKTDRCNSNHKNCRTAERVLQDAKIECEKNYPNNTQYCMDKFNYDFVQSVYKIYEEECAKYHSSSFPLNCRELAAEFTNIFGDCQPPKEIESKKSSSYFLQILLGEHSAAESNQLCQCFNVFSAVKKNDEHYTQITSDPDYLGTKVPRGWSVIPPGKAAEDNSKFSQRPVTREMLEQMKVVPNSQISKEFISGYERSSDILYNSAVKVYDRIKSEILPMAHADTGGSSAESSLNRRLSANNDPLRIADPFSSTSGRDGSSISSYKNSERANTNHGGSGSKNAKSSSPEGSSLVATNAGGSSPNTGNGGTTNNKGQQQNSFGSDPPLATVSSPIQSKAQRLALADLPAKNGEVRFGGRGKAGVDKKSEGNSDSVASGGARRPNGQGSQSRQSGNSNSLAGRGTSSGKNLADRQPAAIPTEFTNVGELLKYLTGTYRHVKEALEKPEFVKSLIDFRVRVINHESQVFGSRQPDYILQFNKANGALNIVKWK
jgi:hypothetical protein